MHTTHTVQRTMGQWYKSNVHISSLPEKLVIHRVVGPMDDDGGDDGGLVPLALEQLFGGQASG